MSMSDPLGDMLTRIRNGQSAHLASVRSPYSKLRLNVLEVLLREGFIGGYHVEEIRSGISEIKIDLRYQSENPVIREIVRVSTPGRRIYSGITDLPRYKNGLGITILSTPSGVMSDMDAREANVGGEVLCRCF